MGEMIERLAKVVEDKLDELTYGDYNFDQDGYERLALAVVAAMRDPTARMLRRADDIFEDPNYDRIAELREAYQAMIDAALSEKDAANVR